LAEFVRYTLADGSEVVFETAESDLVAQHGGEPDVIDGGALGQRLRGVAAAAEEVADSLRGKLRPSELALEFGLKLSGEVNWWFFAKQQAEGTIKVTLKWTQQPERTAPGADEPEDPEPDGLGSSPAPDDGVPGEDPAG
jgi:hypothetical protein